MHKKIFTLICVVLVLVFIGVGYYYYQNYPLVPTVAPTPPVTRAITTVVNVKYKNDTYGFILFLPDAWKGYSVVTSKWEDSVNKSSGGQKTTNQGPIVSVRNPNWSTTTPMQDIPVMVFTQDEWSRLQKNEFNIDAAPVKPSMLGRNAKYVFALPARYNYAYLSGYEEVERIIKSNTPLQAF